MRLSLLCLLIAGLLVAGTAISQEQPIVQTAKHFRITPPLRDMQKVKPGIRDRSWKDNVIRNEIREREVPGAVRGWQDPLWQQQHGRSTASFVGVNFDGLGNLNGVLPPDTDGDVGPNHYFQMINLSYAIYDKTGTLIHGPFDNSTLWDGFIGPWTGTNDGDPIVLYDEQADRWLVSQFAVDDVVTGGTYWELIAVSATGDPTGVYYQYAFQFPDFNDYPKFGIWPDGYYASFNMFGNVLRGAAAAFERDSMLVGAPGARMVLFDLASGSDPWNMLPADFDGTPPPTGTPNFFAYFNDYNPDEIRIWEFDVDWANTANSTFTQSTILYPSPFDSDICPLNRDRCIDQPGTTQKLESLADRLMYRLQYRNFGSYETMVVNHTVDVGSEHAGIRWYEFRDTGSGWTIEQEGTYAPDADHRWMGSIAMDGAGNIGLGYSVSSDTTYPSIRYTGRLAGDPPGQMTIAETELIAGGGSQTSTHQRWGDYAAMAVDPADDSTFWFTTEYMQSTSSSSWKTRISSFRLEPAAPIVNYIAAQTFGMVNVPLQFTDVSLYAPTSWQWNFPGASQPAPTSQNPVVTYTRPGFYDVTLTASNAIGSDHLTKPDYIEVIQSQTVFYDDFENSTGWTLTNEFEIGPPTGAGGEYGFSDPSFAFQGSNVLGVDLSGTGLAPGDYENDLADRGCQAESPSFDCSAYSSVKLTFMRWLNVEQPDYDHAYIDVFDGTTWNEVWTNTTEIADNTDYTLMEYDISSIAAGKPNVKIRFSIGATDGSWRFSGWNIDSLTVLGYNGSNVHHVHWKGTQGGDWNTPGNWSSGLVPADTTSVSIPAIYPGAYAPDTLSQPQNEIRELIVEPGAIFNLNSGDSLIINSGAGAMPDAMGPENATGNAGKK